MARVPLPRTAKTEDIEKLKKLSEETYSGHEPVTVEHDERGRWRYTLDEQEAAAWAATVEDFFNFPN